MPLPLSNISSPLSKLPPLTFNLTAAEKEPSSLSLGSYLGAPEALAEKGSNNDIRSAAATTRSIGMTTAAAATTRETIAVAIAAAAQPPPFP